MYTKDAIIQYVEKPTPEKFIHLRYGFLKADNKFKYHPSDKAKISEEEKAFFRDNLRDNRLILTVGKIARVVSQKTVPKKFKYGNSKKILDLEGDAREYFLRPNESVIIFTNEWLYLDNETSMFVFSKVANYVNGLIVTASFVDPQWKGLIQLMLTNHSCEYRSIKIGDPVASAFFMKTIGTATAIGESSAEFVKHNKIFWSELRNNKFDPFEQEKVEDNTPPEYVFKKHFTFDNFKRNVIPILNISALLGIITFSISIYLELQEYKKTKQEVGKITNLEKKVNHLEIKEIEAGDATIIIPGGKEFGEKDLYVPRKFNSAKILIENVSSNSAKKNFKTEIYPANEGTNIKFIILSDKIAEKTQLVDFEYYIIPK